MKKKYLSLFFLMVFVLFSNAQTKPKSKTNEKPPTQKEVDEMMKEMEAAMKEMDPESKAMMDSMGIKMPDLKSVPKFKDGQYAAADAESKQVVPVLDAKRIASVKRQVLSESSLKNHLQETQTKLEQAMRPELRNWVIEKTNALVKEYGSGNTLAQIALNCHIVGLQELAAYLMCKVVIAHPDDPTHLNNYASILNTLDAQHLALPILITINAKFRRDYTVINNIGQAWYGLGDMQMAGKYIDSAIQLYPRNPQALHTKSKIETKKGNKEAAKEALKKSLEEVYSSDKDYELRQLGGELDKKESTRWTMPMPKDVFGLSNFATPEFPMSIKQSEIMEKQWEEFRDQCNAMIEALGTKRETAEQEAIEAMEKRQKDIFSNKTSFLVPWLAPKAQFRMRMLQERNKKNSLFAFFDARDKYLNIQDELDPLEEIFEMQVKAINDKYPFGEGLENNFAAHCADMNKAINNFLSTANTLISDRYKNYITHLKVFINEQAEYSLYANFKEDYEVHKLLLQQEWITAISTPPVRFHGPANTCPRPEPPTVTTTKLGNFYDRNCEYVSEFYVPLIGKWTQRCDIMTVELFTKIPIGPATLNLGGTYVINSDTKHENGTIEIGVSVGVGSKAFNGPLNTGVKVEGKTILHLTDRGITDVELGGALGVKTGFGGEKGPSKDISPIIKGSITHVGAEGKFSIMNGPPRSGKVKFMEFKF